MAAIAAAISGSSMCQTRAGIGRHCQNSRRITDAIVTAIEPQIYAAENFRSRRKPPNNVDAWDLVMRALSHHWRVTRTDSAAAQALLEKAIAIDPDYGQALSLIATNKMFG